MVNIKYVHTYKAKFIRQYRDKWGNVKINIIPYDINIHTVDDVLRIMINTGYTFIAAYFIYAYPEKIKTENVKMVKMSKIKDNSKPSDYSEVAIAEEAQNIRRGSIIPIVIDSKYNIVSGTLTYKALRKYKEKYIPCIILKNNKTEQNSESKNTSVCKSTRRQELFNEFNGKCYICGRQTHLDENEGRSDLLATVDHIKPVSRGGETVKENLALCCKMCNQLKNEFSYSPELKELIIKELKDRHLM